MPTNGGLHPGISLHKRPVSGGAGGLLFAVGSMLVFLLGIPAMRWFLVGSIVLGVGVAGGLWLFHKHSSSPLTQLPPARRRL
jgi:hypothetical protein